MLAEQACRSPWPADAEAPAAQPTPQHHPAAAPAAPGSTGRGRGPGWTGTGTTSGTVTASRASAGLGGAAVNTSNFTISCRVGEMVLDVQKANGGFSGERVGHMVCWTLHLFKD